jgi:hypothetical protein
MYSVLNQTKHGLVWFKPEYTGATEYVCLTKSFSYQGKLVIHA